MEKFVINRNRQLKNHTLYAYDKLTLISNRSYLLDLCDDTIDESKYVFKEVN